MKKAFSGLTSALDTAEERISELEAMSKGIPQTKENKDRKTRIECPRSVGQLQRC